MKKHILKSVIYGSLIMIGCTNMRTLAAQVQIDKLNLPNTQIEHPKFSNNCPTEWLLEADKPYEVPDLHKVILAGDDHYPINLKAIIIRQNRIRHSGDVSKQDISITIYNHMLVKDKITENTRKSIHFHDLFLQIDQLKLDLENNPKNKKDIMSKIKARQDTLKQELPTFPTITDKIEDEHEKLKARFEEFKLTNKTEYSRVEESKEKVKNVLKKARVEDEKIDFILLKIPSLEEARLKYGGDDEFKNMLY